MASTLSHGETTMAESGPGEGNSSAVNTLYRFLRSIPVWVLWLIVLIWSLPTVGLFVSGFRNRDAQRSSGWWTISTDDLTLDNYRDVFEASSSVSLRDSLLNSMAIAIPATVIPIAIAAFAAYAFAWIDFKGRKTLFIGTVALLAIPLQVALIPLLQLYVGGAHWTIPGLDKTITIFPDIGLNGEPASGWLTHTRFAHPIAWVLFHK